MLKQGCWGMDADGRTPLLLKGKCNYLVTTIEICGYIMMMRLHGDSISSVRSASHASQ